MQSIKKEYEILRKDPRGPPHADQPPHPNQRGMQVIRRTLKRLAILTRNRNTACVASSRFEGCVILSNQLAFLSPAFIPGCWLPRKGAGPTSVMPHLHNGATRLVIAPLCIASSILLGCASRWSAQYCSLAAEWCDIV
jgi:hypothetical protein